MIFCGLLLPLQFLAQADGYLYYLRPSELIFVHATAWGIYFLLGIASTAVVLLLAAMLAAALRMPLLKMFRSATIFFAITCIIFALLDGSRRWVEAVGLIPHIHAMTVAIVILAALAAIIGGVVWICLRKELPGGILQFTRFAFVLGLLSITASIAFPSGTFGGRSEKIAEPKVLAQPTIQPNIVLITVDTFSADHMSLFGYDRPTTPGLERLAQQAYVFDNFYANSNFTTASVNSLLGGVYPWTHRALMQGAHPTTRAAEQQLIAQLKIAGFTTMAVATNPWASPLHNLSARWLDNVVYDERHEFSAGPMAAIVAPLRYSEPVFDLALLKALMRAMDYFAVLSGIWSPTGQHDPQLAFASARTMLQGRDKEKPFFLWVHLFGPHQPYAVPPPFLGRFDASSGNRTCFDSSPPTDFAASQDPSFPKHYVGRYDEGVAYFDDSIDNFVSWLKQQGLFMQTLLVITADHGESFTHGYGSHGGPLLTDELIRIPLLIKAPAQERGKRISAVSGQVDLMPTLLDILGIAAPEFLEGRSLKPSLLGNDVSGPVFSMNFQQNSRFDRPDTGTVAMIEGNWKYIHYLGRQHYPFMPHLEDELFNLESDRGENRNLIATQPAISSKMLEAINRQLQIHGGAMQ